MKKTTTSLLFLSLTISLMAQKTPDKIYGQMFLDVQNGNVFPDSKTFVDCTPKRKVSDIMYDFGIAKGSGLDLKKFVADNFNLPAGPPAYDNVMQKKDVVKHIKSLWAVLKRDADKSTEGSSLLGLPNNYIVPGGRFREIYYWDSYFTMLGLKESGEEKMMESMIDNFAYLINTYGHIPNGNRSYYISRSQPPFFSMMVELLASIKGDGVYKKYLLAMQKEYDYWMEGAATLKNGTSFKRATKLKDGTILNRYWDDLDIPRQEGFVEDTKTADAASTEKMITMRFASNEAMVAFKTESDKNIFKNLRAGACSGWDFSSRWFADANKISTIQVLDIAPVDLNCLLYRMEKTLEKSYGISKNENMRKRYNSVAYKREQSFRKYFKSSALDFFSDYNFVTNKTTDVAAASSLYILKALQEPNPEGINSWGVSAKKFIEKYLLKDGGIVSTPNATGQQWDAPNGWAPQQWMAIEGLERCNQKALAKDIAMRWIKLNNDVYLRTNKLMEKYNVVDLKLEAGGGEYPSQDGFGWTNGVLLALIKKYDKKNAYLGSSK
jgi:alpha,alpha-trehalase